MPATPEGAPKLQLFKYSDEDREGPYALVDQNPDMPIGQAMLVGLGKTFLALLAAAGLVTLLSRWSTEEPANFSDYYPGVTGGENRELNATGGGNPDLAQVYVAYNVKDKPNDHKPTWVSKDHPMNRAKIVWFRYSSKGQSWWWADSQGKWVCGVPHNSGPHPPLGNASLWQGYRGRLKRPAPLLRWAGSRMPKRTELLCMLSSKPFPSSKDVVQQLMPLLQRTLPTQYAMLTSKAKLAACAVVNDGTLVNWTSDQAYGAQIDAATLVMRFGVRRSTNSDGALGSKEHLRFATPAEFINAIPSNDSEGPNKEGIRSDIGWVLVSDPSGSDANTNHVTNVTSEESGLNIVSAGESQLNTLLRNMTVRTLADATLGRSAAGDFLLRRFTASWFSQQEGTTSSRGLMDTSGTAVTSRVLGSLGAVAIIVAMNFCDKVEAFGFTGENDVSDTDKRDSLPPLAAEKYLWRLLATNEKDEIDRGKAVIPGVSSMKDCAYYPEEDFSQFNSPIDNAKTNSTDDISDKGGDFIDVAHLADDRFSTVGLVGMLLLFLSCSVVCGFACSQTRKRQIARNTLVEVLQQKSLDEEYAACHEDDHQNQPPRSPGRERLFYDDSLLPQDSQRGTVRGSGMQDARSLCESTTSTNFAPMIHGYGQTTLRTNPSEGGRLSLLEGHRFYDAGSSARQGCPPRAGRGGSLRDSLRDSLRASSWRSKARSPSPVRVGVEMAELQRRTEATSYRASITRTSAYTVVTTDDEGVSRRAASSTVSDLSG